MQGATDTSHLLLQRSLTLICEPAAAVQLRGGVLYVAAGADPAQFGQQLGSALQLVEALPNPVFLVYDYVLHIAGGQHTSRLIRRALSFLSQYCQS